MSTREGTSLLFTSSLQILHVIDCTKLHDKIRAHIGQESCVFFPIPIDFCIELRIALSLQFWSLLREYFNCFGASFPMVQILDT